MGKTKNMCELAGEGAEKKTIATELVNKCTVYCQLIFFVNQLTGNSCQITPGRPKYSKASCLNTGSNNLFANLSCLYLMLVPYLNAR